MRRLLTLLMMLVVVSASSSALEAAVCRHGSVAAHIAALHSHDRGIAAAASNEETAASTADKQAGLADAGSQLLAGYVLPSGPPLVAARAVAAMHPMAPDSQIPAGASPPPLLQPPAI